MAIGTPIAEAGVRAARDAELSAFYRAEYGRLVRALTLYCGDREVAAELAQEAMARAWRHWDRVRTMDSPRGWLHRVGINLANSAFKPRPPRPVVASVDPSAPDMGTAVAVRSAVAALPRRQRTALVLRYFVDLSVEDVARLMRCRPGTVRALTSQAITRLRASAGLHDMEEAE